MASGKKGKKKTAAAKEQPALSPTPDCSVRVARDLAAADDAAADTQGISGACFCAGGEIMVSYGSDVKPTFVQVRFAKADGSFVPSVELPRISGGLFNQEGALGKSPRLQARSADGRLEEASSAA